MKTIKSSKTMKTIKTIKTMNTIKLLSLLAVFAIALTSCSDDDDTTPEPINEEEVITTTTVTLTDAAGNQKVFVQTDDDGEGPNAPQITTDNLDANTTYTGTVKFENELETPVENITEEVAEEALEHQVFYVPSSGLNATVTYNDQDSNGNPLGLDIILVTNDASTGSLTVTLRHEPMKDAAGVSDGDLTNAGGETDMEAVFPVTIQ